MNGSAVRNNPNAVVAILSAGPGAQVVLEASSWFGWTISTGAAIYISAALAGFALLIGRAGAMIATNGLKGCWQRLVDGPPKPPEG